MQSQFARPVGELIDLQQKPARTIKAGESLTQEIGGGETQSFSVSMAARQYAEFVIEQHGSVLLAIVFDPQGQEVIRMDFPGGGYGPINLSLIAELSGDYRLEVRSINKWAKVKDYSVAITALRAPNANDRSMVENQLSFAEARKRIAGGNAAAAIDPYKRALAYWQASEDRHWEAVTQFALSEAYRISNNWKESEESLNETLRILGISMAPNAWRLKASSLNDLGPVHARAGRLSEASVVLNRAFDLYAAHNDNRGQASALSNLASLQNRQGNFTKARELIEKALEFRNAENDQPGAIQLLNALGVIADRLGEPDKALNYLTRALHAWQELGGQAFDKLAASDRPRVAQVLNNLAATNDKLGNFNQALEYYEQALTIFKKDDPNRAPTLDNQGELYASLGDLQKASRGYNEALSLLAGPQPDLDLKAGLLVHIGQLHLIEGDLKRALSHFREARDLKPNPPKRADVLTNLGAALASDGDLEGAMEAYKEAYEIQLELKDQRGQALLLQKRGEALFQRGENDQALADLNRSLSLWKAVKDLRGGAATLTDIARVEQKRGDLGAARARSDDAIKIIESLRTSISARQLRVSYFATRESYYEFDVDLKMQSSKREKTAENVAAAFESNEKSRARVLLDSLSEAAVGQGETGEVSDPQLAIMTKQRETLSEKLTAKAWARTKLLNGVHSKTQLASIDKDIDELSAQYDELEGRIRAHNPRFNSLIRPKPSLLKEIQAQLDADTLLLEYSLGESRSYVWAVTADSIEGFELRPRKEIEAAANRLNAALTERNRTNKNETAQAYQRRITQADAGSDAAAAALSEMVLKPVAALLGNKRLVIVADGALQLVSFAALPVPASASSTAASVKVANSRNAPSTPLRILNDDHEIVYEPSASVLVLQRRELGNRAPAPYEVAVLANPVFEQDDPRVSEAIARSNRRPGAVAEKKAAPNSGKPTEVSNNGRTNLRQALDDLGLIRFPPLPYSKKEANSIINAAGQGRSRIALDFHANRATAMSPELSKYRMIHFATHGVANFAHPELSGIVLSMVDENGQPQDGHLRLHDIYNLRLPADLVVLSACQTAVGKQIRGEGLIALTRGFMYAGAQRVVASLWKVDDAATADLMAEFYDQMLTKKLRPAAALRAAQLKIARQPARKSPYFWAGFVLQGEWK